MRVKMWVAAGVLACCIDGASAQAGPGGPVSPAKAEDAMLTILEGELTDVVKAMPADRFSFAPSSAVFAPGQRVEFEGVRTFAQEATHIMQANYNFYSLIGGTKPDVDVKSLGTLTTKDQILPALAASFAYAHKAIATITPASAFETIVGAHGMNTRITLASFGIAHGFDHYGQMVEYLRMNGVVPPGSK